VLSDRSTLRPVRDLVEHTATEYDFDAIRCHAFALAAPVGASGDAAGKVARWSLEGSREQEG
jgi:hypothetical protein